jgi:hypothetical protein
MISREWIAFIVRIAFFSKWVAYSLHALMPLHQNHFWRQYDTLGVSIRYFQNLFLLDDPGLGWRRWLPAILQSGDSSGITPMEFPILNLATSWLWSFGPHWGRVACSFALVTAVYGLCFLLYRRRKGKEGIAFLLVPFLSFTAENSYKFIPDVIAALLVCLATVEALDARYRRAFFLSLLGILMKPIALAVLFVLIYYRKGLRELIQKDFGWTGFSAGIGFLYYTKGVEWMKSQGNTGTFAIAPRDPVRAIADVASDFPSFLNFLNSTLMYWGGLWIFVVLMALRWNGKSQARLLLALFGSLFLVVLLDGKHAIIHDYYFAGVALPVCLIVYEALFHPVKTAVAMATPRFIHQGALYLFLAATFVLHPVELLIHDFHALPKVISGTTEEQACVELKKETPSWPWDQGFVFRSDPLPFPKLGVCFRERVGSEVARYGFFLDHSAIPKDCRTVYEKDGVTLVECQT